MQLGGWTRIGIVLSVLYGLSVGLVAFISCPRLEEIHNAWFTEAADVIADAVSEERNNQYSPSVVREFRDRLFKGTNSENVAWLEEVAITPTESQKKFASKIVSVNAKN